MKRRYIFIAKNPKKMRPITSSTSSLNRIAAAAYAGDRRSTRGLQPVSEFGTARRSAVVIFAGDSPKIPCGGSENIPISCINKAIRSTDLLERHKETRKSGGLCQKTQGKSGSDLEQCQKGDQLYITSGEPVPYAYGIEFLFTKCSQMGTRSPIDGLVDAIIGNKERVTSLDKSKHGAVGVYKAQGDRERAVGEQGAHSGLQLQHRADFHVSHRDRRPLA